MFSTWGTGFYYNIIYGPMQLQKKACESVFRTMFFFLRFPRHQSCQQMSLQGFFCTLFCCRTMSMLLAIKMAAQSEKFVLQTPKCQILAPSKKLSINGTHKRDAHMRMRFKKTFPDEISANSFEQHSQLLSVPKMGNSCCPAEDGHVRRLKYIYIYSHDICTLHTI